MEGLPGLRGFNDLPESGALAYPHIILGNPGKCPTPLTVDITQRRPQQPSGTHSAVRLIKVLDKQTANFGENASCFISAVTYVPEFGFGTHRAFADLLCFWQASKLA